MKIITARDVGLVSFPTKHRVSPPKVPRLPYAAARVRLRREYRTVATHASAMDLDL